MPKPLPVKYQPNSRRLWLPWDRGYAVVSEKALLRHRSWGKYGWYLPNTRRWRKIVRKALSHPRIMYDLIVDPGAAGVGCVFDGPPSYMYTQYGVRLDAGPANPSGRFGKSQPNWQDLPRKGRLIGSAFKVEQDREYSVKAERPENDG